MPSVLLFALTAYFGTSLLTADHVLNAAATLVTFIVGLLVRETNKATTRPTPPEAAPNLYDLTVEANALTKATLERLEKIGNEGGPYQHERNHDILNGIAKVFAVQVLAAKQSGLVLPIELLTAATKIIEDGSLLLAPPPLAVVPPDSPPSSKE